MKVSTVNFACWCASGVFVLALIGFALQHKGRENQQLSNLSEDTARVVLKGQASEGDVTEVIKRLDYNGEVVPRWHRFNWTGEKPPEKQPDRPVGPPPEKPRKKVSDLLAIIFIQVDTDDPGGSRIRVKYKGELASNGTAQLMVGDKLPAPHAYAAVHAIHPESVVFSFTPKDGEDEAMENETVEAFNELSRFPIHKVEGGVVIAPRTERSIPKYEKKATSKLKTEEIANNTWQLGTEDVQEFADDYQRILTQDVKTRTYYDKDGKRAGVEITEVKTGSIAARHGAREGDVVISINGHPVSSEQEAIKYVKNNSETTSVWEVVIMNMGRTETRVFRSPED